MLALGSIDRLLAELPPLHRRKSPQLAGALGFLFGGVRLGLYFLSFVDALIPIGIVIGLSVGFTGFAQLDPSIALLGGAIVASLYGYFRSLTSNSKLEARLEPEVRR